jgi:YHS domain-containing protein
VNGVETLKARLDETLARVERRQSEVRTAREDEMRQLDTRRDEFERVASGWVRAEVIPRLRLLAGALTCGEEPECSPDGCSAWLKVPRKDAYPVSASLSISLVPDAQYRRGYLQLDPVLIPMFAGHPRSVRYECEVVPGPFPQSDAVDNIIVQFLERYLAAGDSNSPYQRDRLVRDPVCGMSIRRTEASDSMSHEGTTYFFCASSCAERFRAGPGRYLKGSGTPDGESGAKP